MIIVLVFLLNIINSHNISANSMRNSKTKYFKTSIGKSKFHFYTYLHRYDCNNGKTNCSRSNRNSIIDEFRNRYRLLGAGKFNKKMSKWMNIPRCGVINGPLLYSAENRWYVFFLKKTYQYVFNRKSSLCLKSRKRETIEYVCYNSSKQGDILPTIYACLHSIKLKTGLKRTLLKYHP